MRTCAEAIRCGDRWGKPFDKVAGLYRRRAGWILDLSFLWKIRYDTPLGRLVRLPLKALPGTMPILQGPARGKRWVVASGPSMYWLGSYEYPKQRLLADLLSEGGVLYDVGAHVGYFTVLGAAIVGSAGRVVAFEPAPVNVDFLRRNVSINGFENVDVWTKAVGDRVGELRFDDSTGSSFTGHLSNTGSLVVESTTLDRVHEEGAPLPAVIKLDVEGAELSVLEGARTVIETGRPTLLVATHGDDVHAACREFLTKRRYRVEPLRDGSKVVPGELVAYP